LSLPVADTAPSARSGYLVRVLERASRGPTSALGAALCLTGIAAIAVAVYVGIVARQPGPFIFFDELAYERMADSFAHTGRIALLGKVGLTYSPLYSVVISPIYALTSSAVVAYEWVKRANVVMMASSVFPIYGIARFLLSRRLALAVTALAMFAPPMLYAALIMSENIAYPLFLVAIWAMLRAVRQPRATNDVVLLVTIGLASAARLQQIVLVPAAIVAVLLVALVAADESRIRAAYEALARHWVLVGSALLALVLVILGWAVTGALPLSGRYANVGTVHPPLLRTARLFIEHLAELDVAVGVVPFAAAVLAALALRTFGFPRTELVFGAVALSVTAGLLFEVAWDGAEFDSTRLVTGSAGIPRLHERYLIYLVPLFLVALFAVLRRRRRMPLSRHVAAAAVAAALPATIPFGLIINNSIVADSFAMQLFAEAGGTYVPIAHARLSAVGLATLLASSLIVAAWRPRRWAFATAIPAIVATLVAFLLVSNLVRQRLWIAANGAVTAGVPGKKNWVDSAVGHEHVVLVTAHGGLGDLETVFFNLSVDRVYEACESFFPGDFAVHHVTADPGTGVLGDVQGGNGTVVAADAVVPKSFGVAGRVIADDGQPGLVLVAPPTRTLIVPESARASLC
jgi:hypothetical protein